MRYTPIATDALCPMPYALCPMPTRAPHVTEKGYISLISSSKTATSPSSGKLVTKRNSVFVSTSQKFTIL